MGAITMRNFVNDLWILSICIAVTAYIVMAFLLLTFDPEITAYEKGGFLGMYVVVSLVLASKYTQAMKTFEFYEKILEGGLASGSFSNFKYKECLLRPSLDKSRVRSFSYPMSSIEYRSYQYTWEHVPVNEMLRNYLNQLKSKAKIVASDKPIETSCKGLHEIPANLHKCVKDLDSVIPHVKSLNLYYTRNFNDTSVLNQNSETTATKENLENQITEEEDIQRKPKSTKFAKETSCTIKNPSIKTWTPVKNMDNVIQHVKSHLDNIKKSEDTSAVNQNTETVIKFKNQIAEKEGDTQLESTKREKEISCTIKSPSMKTWTPVKDLDSVIQDAKLPNLDCTRNLGDALFLIQNSESVAKDGNQENQIAAEDIQHKLESTECTKETSCTLHSSINTWTQLNDLDSVSQHVKSVNLDYTKNIEDTLFVSQNSNAVTKKGNLENQTAEEDEGIQHKLESTSYAKETSSTLKSPNMKSWTSLKNLDNAFQHVKSLNLYYTKSLEDTLILNQNSVTLANEDLENQIAEEEDDIKHKNIKGAKEISCSISPSMKTWTPEKELGNVSQDVRSPNLGFTRNMEDTKDLYQDTKTVSKKENQIVEAEGDIRHKPESTKCTKETSCTTESPSMKTWTSVKDLDNVIQHVKSPNLDYTKNLDDTSDQNQKSETVTKNGNRKNQTAEEEKDTQHKLENMNCTKEISCTIKIPGINSRTPVKDLDNVSQHVKWPKLDYTKGLEDTLVLKQNSERMGKENLENQIAEEEEGTQYKLENTKCANEIASAIKSPSMKTWTQVNDLDNGIQHVKTVNIGYTRNLEYTLGPIRNTVTKKENQIAEEEGGIKHKFESTECAKETACTIKKTRTKTWTLVKNLDSVIQHVKLIILDYTRNLDDTSVLNQNSERVTKKNLENQIAEEMGDIHHKLESTKCTKEISCTLKSNNILQQRPHRDLGTKEKLTERIKMTPQNIPEHILWTSMLGTYFYLNTAAQFMRKVINADVNLYTNFLIKIPLKQQEFSKINPISNLYLKKFVLLLYKTTDPIKPNTKALVSFNKHVPNIPMKRYAWKVSVTPYIREISRERYNYMISKRESKIRKNKSTITNDTHKNLEFIQSLPTKGNGIAMDEMLLLFQWYLPLVMTDPSTTANEILIPKFQEADLKKFLRRLNRSGKYICNSVSRKNKNDS